MIPRVSSLCACLSLTTFVLPLILPSGVGGALAASNDGASVAASPVPERGGVRASASAAPLAVEASAVLRVPTRLSERVVVASRAQPAAFRYAAFPTLLRMGQDEVWLAYKTGRSHATDAGSAIEIARHTLSSGRTELLQRLVAPEPQLYQMGELVRQPGGAVEVHIDAHHVGWDGRHYRTGAECARWDAAAKAFGAPLRLAPVDGVLYGYPLEFAAVGRTVWQLTMAFGYHQPGGRWSVDALRSDDDGRSWHFVRNLTEAFGGIRANESGFVPYDGGFIVATRGYDRIVRLHRTDDAFRILRQADLTGRSPFVHSYVGRPRLFVRDGAGYLIGRNWTKPADKPGSPMQLCLLRFDPETLAVTGCAVLDNAEGRNVTDGYYAVTTFSGEGRDAVLHVFTYRALNKQPPDIVRLDFRWEDVR